jgi:PD-(D/E)XK nuclease superfamily
MTSTFRVPPATLGYLLRDCERCFVRDVRYRVRRPGAPSPVYNLADGAMKRAFDVGEGCWIDIGVPEAPRFRPIAQGFAVASAPIVFPDVGVELVLAGMLDAFVETDDGRRILVDYKTSSEVSAARYAGQLSGYAFALQNPAAGVRYEATIVDAMALLVFQPRSFVAKRTGVCGLYGPTTWIEVPQDDRKFLELMRRVAALLGGIIPPAAAPSCSYCTYFASSLKEEYAALTP